MGTDALVDRTLRLAFVVAVLPLVLAVVGLSSVALAADETPTPEPTATAVPPNAGVEQRLDALATVVVGLGVDLGNRWDVESTRVAVNADNAATATAVARDAITVTQTAIATYEAHDTEARRGIFAVVQTLWQSSVVQIAALFVLVAVGVAVWVR